MTRRYSELECFVLGLIWQLGPCSPYDVRRHLQASPSSQWSASAGAIYPLVRRLHALKLLKVKDERTGERARRMYTLTPVGLAVLRQWIGPPLTGDAISVAHDPLRSRARFLKALSPAQRRDWVRSALATLDEVARRIRAWHDEFAADDPYLAMITEQGELETEARQRWLQRVAKVVAK